MVELKEEEKTDPDPQFFLDPRSSRFGSGPSIFFVPDPNFYCEKKNIFEDPNKMISGLPYPDPTG